MKNKSTSSKKCTLVYQNSFTWFGKGRAALISSLWERRWVRDAGREAACWIYAGGSRVAMDHLLRKYTRLSVVTVQPQSLLQNCLWGEYNPSAFGRTVKSDPELGKWLFPAGGCSACVVLYPSGCSLQGLSPSRC